MISKFARFTLVLGVGVLAVAALATAQAKDPFVGTWNMNLAKSKYSPGPAPKSTTSTYEAAGKGYKVSVKSRTGDWSGAAVVLHLQLRWQRRHRSPATTRMRTRWPRSVSTPTRSR